MQKQEIKHSIKQAVAACKSLRKCSQVNVNQSVSPSTK